MGSRSQSVKRYWEHRRALWRVSPGEFVELQKSGTISESLKRAAVLAQEEGLALISAMGGLENVSEQRLVLIQDTVRLGLVLRAVVARFLQGDGDAELATKVGTLASARRSSLQALGLNRVAKEIDLTTYLREKASQSATESPQSGVSGTEDTEDDARAADVTHGASVRPGGGAPEQECSSPSPAAVSTSTDTQED
jgi:hypothetical protein